MDSRGLGKELTLRTGETMLASEGLPVVTLVKTALVSRLRAYVEDSNELLEEVRYDLYGSFDSGKALWIWTVNNGQWKYIEIRVLTNFDSNRLDSGERHDRGQTPNTRGQSWSPETPSPESRVSPISPMD